MNYHDPNRPHTPTGLPCWTTCKEVALPRLYLTPIATGGWRIEIMVADGNEGRFWTKHLDQFTTSMVLNLWREDPELCLSMYFGREPPIWNPRQTHDQDSPSRPLPKPNPNLGIEIDLF